MHIVAVISLSFLLSENVFISLAFLNDTELWVDSLSFFQHLKDFIPLSANLPGFWWEFFCHLNNGSLPLIWLFLLLLSVGKEHWFQGFLFVFDSEIICVFSYFSYFWIGWVYWISKLMSFTKFVKILVFISLFQFYSHSPLSGLQLPTYDTL